MEKKVNMMVEHLPHHPKFKGLSLASAVNIGKWKTEKVIPMIAHSLHHTKVN
jgi:hypothetical protein